MIENAIMKSVMKINRYISYLQLIRCIGRNATFTSDCSESETLTYIAVFFCSQEMCIKEDTFVHFVIKANKTFSQVFKEQTQTSYFPICA